METALVPVKAALVAATTEPGRVKNVFQAFRAVFEWHRCRRRKIYWFESRWGRTIVRQVTNLNRTKNQEDRLLATIPGKPDVDLIKLVIANSSPHQILTGVAWELYDTFKLETPVASGRFDHMDLLPRDQDQMERLLVQRVVPVNSQEDAWDFDGLLLTHRCYKCRQIFGHDCLVYDQHFMACPCGYKLATEDLRVVTKHMLQRLIVNPSGVVSREARVDFGTFLDIHATSTICNCIKLLRIPALDTHTLPTEVTLSAFTDDHLRACYQLSLLPLLKSRLTREPFLGYVDAFYERRLAGLADINPLGKDPELVREMRIAWIRNEKARFLECLDGFEDFETWYFLGPEQVANEKVGRLKKEKILSWLPGFLEDFIIDLGERLLAEERNVPG